MESQHLQSGLVQPPPIRRPLLQSVSHIQISLNWRQQGDRVWWTLSYLCHIITIIVLFADNI